MTTADQPATEVEPASSAEVEPTDIPPEVLRALYVAYLKSYAAKAEKLTRPVVGVQFPRAGTTPFRAPSGEKLGEVQREDPPPRWAITDGAALRDHLMADPKNVETSEELDPPTADDLIALVREHRPEWFQTTRYLRDGLTEAALQQARDGGKVLPGIELYKPAGDLVIRADKDHARLGEVYGRMIRAGQMNPDGTTPEVEHVTRRPLQAAPRLQQQLGTRVTTRQKDAADDAYDRGEEPWAPEADPFAGVPVDPFAGIEIQQ